MYFSCFVGSCVHPKPLERTLTLPYPALPSIASPVTSDERVHFVPRSAAGSSAIRDLLPQLFYHHLSESGLESFMVVPPSRGEEGGGVGSVPVANVPFYPKR